MRWQSKRNAAGSSARRDNSYVLRQRGQIGPEKIENEWALRRIRDFGRRYRVVHRINNDEQYPARGQFFESFAPRAAAKPTVRGTGRRCSNRERR